MALIDLTARNTHIDARPSAGHLTLRHVLDVWRSRRALARLDARALADIGISAKSAHSEARKPIWDVPGTWRV